VQNIEVISNKINNKEVAAQAVSRDLQSVSSTIAVNYRIEHAMSAEIYKNLEGANPDSVLLPAIQESMKAVSAKYTAEELISKRTQVSLEIKETLENKVSEYGVFVERFNIVNFDFSEEFNKAIEEKQVAEQNLIKTKTEQEQQIVIANAEAEKKVIAAQADADAITAKAEAQADANRRLTESLSDILVDYEKVQKWNGELPMVSGDATPIIDMRGND
jgi:regulator of protease activity HflC (stomatin/prohibitin superfamily)